MDELMSLPLVAIEQAPCALPHDDDGSVELFVADHSYVPLVAQVDDPDASIEWTGADEKLDENGWSYASFILNPQATTRAASGPTRREVLTYPVTASPQFTVRGYASQKITFSAAGHPFATGDTFQFPAGSGITVANVAVQNGNLSGDITTAADATQGSVDVIFSLPDPNQKGRRRDVTAANTFTVYQGVIWSLLQILNRPAAGAATQPAPGQPGGNPRTAVQQTRMQAVIDATTVSNLLIPWRAWVDADCSITVGRPSVIDASQRTVLLDAAAKIEANNNRVTLDPQPPAVPVTMWRGFIQFLMNEESNGRVLELASVADETSVGIVQFNDDRSSDNNFTGGTNSPVVPIFQPGRVTTWKTRIVAATDVATLTAVVQSLNGDWRADPFASLVNAIRSSQAYYGRLIKAPNGTLSYNANKSFRVDLNAPARANGDGNQRDTFQFFGVVHRNPGDAFGIPAGPNGVPPALPGGLTTAPTPETWTADAAHMTPAGVGRSQVGATYWNNNAGGGYT